MALVLQFHSSSWTLVNGSKNPFVFLSSSRHFPIPSHSKTSSIRYQNSSSSTEPAESTTTSSSPSDKKSSSSSAAGLGFGSTNPITSKKKQQQQGKKERASIIRRTPLAKPDFASQSEDIREKERNQNESAFLLAWFGLGSIIIVEGIVLAASGFLPEEWDKFFVKYLYPSFTPTVFVFVAGTVTYGVFKYLQNEKPQE